jgi:hypothetical protein
MKGLGDASAGRRDSRARGSRVIPENEYAGEFTAEMQEAPRRSARSEKAADLPPDDADFVGDETAFADFPRDGPKAIVVERFSVDVLKPEGGASSSGVMEDRPWAPSLRACRARAEAGKRLGKIGPESGAPDAELPQSSEAAPSSVARRTRRRGRREPFAAIPVVGGKRQERGLRPRRTRPSAFVSASPKMLTRRSDSRVVAVQEAADLAGGIFPAEGVFKKSFVRYAWTYSMPTVSICRRTGIVMAAGISWEANSGS